MHRVNRVQYAIPEHSITPVSSATKSRWGHLAVVGEGQGGGSLKLELGAVSYIQKEHYGG